MYLTLLVASVAVMILATVIYLRQPFASFMHPVTFYLAFHGFIFVFRPLVAYYYDFQAVYQIYNFQPSMSDKITVILGANLAMITFLFVSFRIANGPIMVDPHDNHTVMRQKLLAPIIIVTTLILPVGAMAQMSKWVSASTDWEDMIVDAGTGAAINTTANGWFTDTSTSLAVITIMLVWLGRYRPWTWVVFLLYAFSQAGTGGRGALMYALAGICMIFLIENRRRWFDLRVAFAGFLGLLAFNAIVQDRGASIRQLFDSRVASVHDSDDGLRPLEHMDFANLEYFEYLVYVVPQRSGSWDYFANNLQIFTEPIPRALWKDKPVGSPVQFYKLFDYGTPMGMTQSVPGTGWASFGWLGIIIQASVFSIIYSTLYRQFMTKRSDLLWRMSYVLLLGTSLVTFRDGVLVTFARMLPFYLGPWLLVIWLARISGFSARPRLMGDLRQTGDQAATPMTPGDRRRALARAADLDAASARRR